MLLYWAVGQGAGGWVWVSAERDLNVQKIGLVFFNVHV